jgi:hypothetical protein
LKINQWYENNLVPLAVQSKLTPIYRVVFIIFKTSEETRVLKKHEKAQEKVVQTYANKDV